jgi:hypothetical protein
MRASMTGLQLPRKRAKIWDLTVQLFQAVISFIDALA